MKEPYCSNGPPYGCFILLKKGLGLVCLYIRCQICCNGSNLFIIEGRLTFLSILYINSRDVYLEFIRFISTWKSYPIYALIHLYRSSCYWCVHLITFLRNVWFLGSLRCLLFLLQASRLSRLFDNSLDTINTNLQKGVNIGTSSRSSCITLFSQLSRTQQCVS